MKGIKTSLFFYFRIVERQCLPSEVLGISCLTSGGFLSKLQEYLCIFFLLERWSLCSREICIRFNKRQAKAVCCIAFPLWFFIMETKIANVSLSSGILQIMLCCRGRGLCIRTCAAIMVLYIKYPLITQGTVLVLLI